MLVLLVEHVFRNAPLTLSARAIPFMLSMQINAPIVVLAQMLALQMQLHKHKCKYCFGDCSMRVIFGCNCIYDNKL
jgi:hypothetical protein